MATRREEIEGGCLSRVAEDEPVFVLRARDRIAPTIVRVWAALAGLLGSSDQKVEEAYGLAHRMERWQEENGSRVPD